MSGSPKVSMRSKECDKAENAARDSFDREDFTNGTFRTGKGREKRGVVLQH